MLLKNKNQDSLATVLNTKRKLNNVGKQHRRCRAQCAQGPNQAKTSVIEPTSANQSADDDVTLLQQQYQKNIDAKGAGKGWVSPGWVTELGRLWGGKSDIPVADAQPEEIQELLGGALFKALYKWMVDTGPVYLLPTGPISSFLVVSDPAVAKHVLRGTDNPRDNVYTKGLVAEVSQFLFGKGFAVAEGAAWKVRRKVVAPSLHKKYLQAMCERVFSPSAQHMNAILAATPPGQAINMEARFSQLTLDVIGKSVFNYDFNALTKESPVIQAVYTALKETEQRAVDLLPYWKIDFLLPFIPRQRKALAAVELIRKTTEELIEQCRLMVDEEEQRQFAESEDFLNEVDPSVLRFLIASRDEVTSTQLRDDLLSMVVAGHETTASALTWTLYLLTCNPEQMARAQEEVDRVLGDSNEVKYEQYAELKYITRCVCESMRLYPHPPVLLRRALKEDMLPGGYKVPQGQDVMISVYNIHHSPAVWDDPEAFLPERFPLDKPLPTEEGTNYRYVPFSGGPRKCVGDQFAMLEAIIALALTLKEFDFELVPDQVIGMTTGATIHTTNGLYMTAKPRTPAKTA